VKSDVIRSDIGESVRLSLALSAARNKARRRNLYRFWAKALTLSAGFAWIVVALLGRFQFALDPQIRSCIPNAHFMVVDRAVRTLARGQLMALNTDIGREPLIEPHALAAKFIIGLPGDHVRVTAAQTTVNGVVVGLGLADTKTAHLDVAKLVRALVVPPGFYWVMGEAPNSYDSRYWGPVPGSDFAGDVHVLF